MTLSSSGTRMVRIVCGVAIVGIAIAIILSVRGITASPKGDNRPERESRVAESIPVSEQVSNFCGACHAPPPPSSFPQFAWAAEVAQGYGFYASSGLVLTVPDQARVTQFYETQAPVELPVLRPDEGETAPPIRFERRVFPHPQSLPSPAASNVRFVQLQDDTRDLLVTDMRHGLLTAIRCSEPGAGPRVLCDVLHNPAHVEVVDLDRDGRRDLLVADLGSFTPTDKTLGSIVWLRASADGSFTPMPIAWGLGRVADVQAADFDGDGDLDLIAAVFGWHAVGEILYLENQTLDYSKPVFISRRLDPRHGAIHVPIADLNGDGRPDFVALFSQEHENVDAYINEGRGQFSRQTIYAAPHPAYGSSGIELIDLDRDGDQDVLYTNGDVLDGKPILRPDHGVHWLENRGTYPFVEHRLTSLYGASQARAADMDGDGDLDIVASSFLPGGFYQPLRSRMALSSLILLEQTSPGLFTRHSLETASNDYASLDLGDFDGDGRVDIATGRFDGVALDPAETPIRSVANGEWIVLLRNLGRETPRTELLDGQAR
jgi:hypothetical protein